MHLLCVFLENKSYLWKKVIFFSYAPIWGKVMTAESTHFKKCFFHYTIELLWSYVHTVYTLSHMRENVTLHCSIFSYAVGSLTHAGSSSVCVWCLVTKRSMSRVREVRGRAVLWRSGREREKEKPQETAALFSLPGESCVKGIGVTLSTQAQSWGISLASLTQRHSSVLPEWTTLTPIRQEVRVWVCVLF